MSAVPLYIARRVYSFIYRVFRQTSGRFDEVNIEESLVDIGFLAFREVLEFGIGSG